MHNDGLQEVERRGSLVDEHDNKELQRLREHILALELEFARYAATYGLTDEARRLLKESPLGRSNG
jgi:DNA-binding GntR family transcriptional regulator